MASSGRAPRNTRRRYQAQVIALGGPSLCGPIVCHDLLTRKTSSGRLASAPEQWRRLEDFFDTGQVAVIDGANGAEI